MRNQRKMTRQDHIDQKNSMGISGTTIFGFFFVVALTFGIAVGMGLI